MQLQGNTAELDAPCSALHFVGTWGQAGDSPARFFGTATLAPLAPAPGADGVQVVLRDTSGQVLLGPVLLQTVAAAQPVTCP